jgi:flagellar hook-associated protein 2
LLKEEDDMSVNRISGMVSGLDTESIVKGLMLKYQAKLDKKFQTRTKYEWQEAAYREVNKSIASFRSKYLSVLSSTNMMSDSALRNYKVDFSAQTDAVSISASSYANECTLTISEISQLATAPSLKSVNVFKGAAYSSDAKLSEIDMENDFQFVDGKISFSINGKTFEFTEDTTMGELLNKVNTSGAGVRMTFSSLTKGFTIQSATTGSSSKIDIVNIAGNAFASENSAFGIAEGVDKYKGKDAVCIIDGVEVTNSSNTFTYDGITYTLKAESDAPITFTVSKDLDTTIGKIKSFIDEYNKLVEDLQNRIKEKVYRSYTPLTETQKKEMSEDDIKLWEEKAKSGLLHGDSYISGLLTKLRSAFYTNVGDTGLSPSSIGLNTGIYSDGGKITIDETKLRKALSEDPDKVKSLFLNNGDNFEDKGLIVRISDSLLAYTKETTDVALDNLDDLIKDSKDYEADLVDKMAVKEDALWRKFAKMEQALSKMYSMQSWLSSTFTGMSS